MLEYGSNIYEFVLFIPKPIFIPGNWKCLDSVARKSSLIIYTIKLYWILVASQPMFIVLHLLDTDMFLFLKNY